MKQLLVRYPQGPISYFCFDLHATGPVIPYSHVFSLVDNQSSTKRLYYDHH